MCIYKVLIYLLGNKYPEELIIVRSINKAFEHGNKALKDERLNIVKVFIDEYLLDKDEIVFKINRSWKYDKLKEEIYNNKQEWKEVYNNNK